MNGKEQKYLGTRYCKECRKSLPEDYEFNLCPHCIEAQLFREVRDYIRENDVTEYEVAEQFKIPISRVRTWIREGRIQYSGSTEEEIMGLHCARCGKAILVGEICDDCMAILRRQKSFGYASEAVKENAGKVRFLKNKLEQ